MLASAALRALDISPKRIAADHRNAKLLERLLLETGGVEIPVPAQTNILAFNLREHHRQSLSTPTLAPPTHGI